MKHKRIIGYSLLVLLLLGSVSLLTHYHTLATHRTVTAAPQAPQKPDAYQLWVLTNDERTKAGLQPLVLDEKLNESALNKCQANVSANTFEHNFNGKTPWDFIKQVEPVYKAAGENLAYDQLDHWTAADTVQNWMGSEHHRENILNPAFTNVGFAVCHADNLTGWGSGDLITQQFTSI